MRPVDGLKPGRSEAKETDDVRSVAEQHVTQVMQHASRHIAAMIELQNWTPGERYDTTGYNRAVQRACDRAFPVPEGMTAPAEVKAWRKAHRFPHRLRHSAATRFGRDYGVDAAGALLGQKSLAAAEIYAESDMETARQVMAAIG